MTTTWKEIGTLRLRVIDRVRNDSTKWPCFLKVSLRGTFQPRKTITKEFYPAKKKKKISKNFDNLMVLGENQFIWHNKIGLIQTKTQTQNQKYKNKLNQPVSAHYHYFAYECHLYSALTSYNVSSRWYAFKGWRSVYIERCQCIVSA